MGRLLVDVAMVNLALLGLARLIGFRSVRYYVRHGKPCPLCEGTGEVFPSTPRVTKAEVVGGLHDGLVFFDDGSLADCNRRNRPEGS